MERTLSDIGGGVQPQLDTTGGPSGDQESALR